MKKSERKSEKSLVLEVARSTEVVAEVVKILVKDSSSVWSGSDSRCP